MPVSSDGVLTATARPFGAVALDVAWPSTPVPWLTRVVRVSGTTETLVRSGDPAYTPGGSGYVQDNEAAPSATVVYKAYGYDGINPGVIRTSMTVTVTTNGLSSPHMARWKPLADMSLTCELPTSIDPTRPRRQDEYVIRGQATTVVQQYDMGARRGTLHVAALSAAQRTAMRAIMSLSTVVLIQFDAAVAVPDLWATLGDDAEAPVGPRRQAVSQWAVPFIEQARPDTAGAPLVIPGWSYAVADAAAATYTARDALYASYNALSKGP